MSQGVELNAMEEVPQDPYMLNRRGFPVRSKKIATVDDKLRRFLEYDGKVLRYRTKIVKITLMYSQLLIFLISSPYQDN